MHVAHLSLHDFRSYPDVEVALGPGVDRVRRPQRAGQDQPGRGDRLPLPARPRTGSPATRRWSGSAPTRRSSGPRWSRDGREAVLEVEINPGRSNRARVNRSPLPRARELLGLVRTVLFSPEDLALVKGDPSERRRFLDDLLVQRAPRFAGVRADYDRVLKQRNTLLKTAGVARRQRPQRRRARCPRSTSGTPTWPALGAELLAAAAAAWSTTCAPTSRKAYEAVARGRDPRRRDDDLQAVVRARPRREPDRDRAGRGAARRGRAPPRRRARPRRHPGRPAPRRPDADARRRCRSRATPATASPGRSRSRCGWRPTTCCAPTATTRS